MKGLIVSLLIAGAFSLNAQTGIGTATPDPSAKLDVTSTTQGFLPPRMTSAQRQNIATPAAGLMVYQTDGTAGLYYYSGSAWLYIINNTTNVLPITNGGTGTTTGTGTGSVVLNTSPTLVSPTIGNATATSINKVAITTPANNATITIADGKSLTANNTITLAGTDATTMTFPSTNATIARTDAAQTFAGTQTFSSAPTISSATGDEGGELNFARSQTNNSLNGNIVLDIYQNKVRIFEGGGNSRGVNIDLSKAPDGVGGELIWKASGIVNAGAFVTLDNIKATVTTTGSRGLSLATVSGSVNGYITSQAQKIDNSQAYAASAVSFSTSATASIFNWNFASQGDTATYILRDDTNSRVYRIIMIIGGSYNNNFVLIERLY